MHGSKILAHCTYHGMCRLMHVHWYEIFTFIYGTSVRNNAFSFSHHWLGKSIFGYIFLKAIKKKSHNENPSSTDVKSKNGFPCCFSLHPGSTLSQMSLYATPGIFQACLQSKRAFLSCLISLIHVLDSSKNIAHRHFTGKLFSSFITNIFRGRLCGQRRVFIVYSLLTEIFPSTT